MNEILIYSDIGESWWGESITAATIKSQLQGDVTVRLNSPGGDVFEGFAIYNLLKQHDGKVTIHVDGLAASAASIIAMAGDEVHMPAASMMMIHDPWTMAVGGVDDMLKTAELLEKVKDAIIPAYTERTGLDADEISTMMTAETWMTGAEAAAKGFATLTEGPAKTVENLAKPWIKNAPHTSEQPEPAWRASLAAKRLALIE